ncbi:LysR family transcriptional regulator [Pseudoalteromonas sp. C2R02]|uniref:LysR family transcriptional regulator n=1 Tax=Pseudoalteromonas sp. C2R02 TaxID=2841565 RepID=UPI001C082307|nr:LysR family transcriptional regulator [Pseudoalteromonas sp. C2R02]MBU2971992.1 LysR family transcriptional regulator [Pseudoalteromonas sp. C2R02]
MKEHKRIERLMLFSHVAKELNFSRAAENMGISRGHLSEQIKFLEGELNTNLLNRSTRHVSLTKDGEHVLACMESIKISLTSMERDIHHEKNELEGELKLTAPLLFAHRFLYDICDDFHKKHPGVTFTLNTSYESHDLNKKDFDIAFRSTKSPPLDMVAKSLLTYQHTIVASANYIKKHGKPESIVDLTGHQCLTAEHQSAWSFKNSLVPITGWISLNDNFSLLQQALDGRGIARLPDYFVEKHLRNKKLVSLLNHEEKLAHQIYVIHPPKIQQSARLKAFLNHVKQKVMNEY